MAVSNCWTLWLQLLCYRSSLTKQWLKHQVH